MASRSFARSSGFQSRGGGFTPRSKTCRASTTGSEFRCYRRQRESWPTTTRATRMWAAKFSSRCSEEGSIMSRIGKRPVPVPSNVTATVDGQTVKMKGPKGELSFTVPDKIKVAKTNAGIEVSTLDDTKMARSMWGMSRTMVANLIRGVLEGYSRTLEIQGVGFRAAMK